MCSAKAESGVLLRLMREAEKEEYSVVVRC